MYLMQSHVCIDYLVYTCIDDSCTTYFENTHVLKCFHGCVVNVLICILLFCVSYAKAHVCVSNVLYTYVLIILYFSVRKSVMFVAVLYTYELILFLQTHTFVSKDSYTYVLILFLKNTHILNSFDGYVENVLICIPFPRR